MPRGRPPLPTAVKKERGTHRKDRGAPGEEPQPVAAILPPPEHLSSRAQKEWRRLVAELSPLGLFTSLDPMALEAHCVAYDIAAKAAEELGEMGALVIELPNGFSQAHPLLDVIAKFYKLAGEFGTKFGLDPAARSTKVRAPKKQDGETNRLAAHRERKKKTA